MALERIPGGWRVRLRYGKGRRDRFDLPEMPRERAEDRAARLEKMAARLANVGPLSAKSALTDAASAATEKDFASCERAIYELARDARKESSGEGKSRYTFRDVAELWLSGQLRERYPDDVPKKSDRSVSMDRGLFAVLYPAIGEIDVTKVTREDCEAAKRLIPAGLRQSSRQRYAALVKRVMDLAVLMGLIEHSPVPRKFVPPAGKPRLRPFLYPDEDATLMRCSAAVSPLGERLAWGFQMRNGCRPGEVSNLTRGDFDLRRGVVNLDENKTDDPRSWALDADVVRALGRYWGQDLDPEAPAFPEYVSKQGARRLRAVLRACGIGRKLLTLSTELRGPMTLHGLRGTFVTVALASGRSEDWVMRRTGHTTSQMVSRYRRQVEALELKGEWFEPLDSLLWPDDVGHDLGQGQQKPRKKGPSRTQGESALGSSVQQPEPPEAAPEKSTASRSGAGPAEIQGVGQAHDPEMTMGSEGGDATEQAQRSDPRVSATTSAPADPVALEYAKALSELALSIRVAAQAGEWALAAKLDAKLDRLTAMQSGVSSLDAARRRKEST